MGGTKGISKKGRGIEWMRTSTTFPGILTVRTTDGSVILGGDDSGGPLQTAGLAKGRARAKGGDTKKGLWAGVP